MGRDRSLDSDFLGGAAAEYLCNTKSLALHLLTSVASYSLQLQPLKKRKRAFPRGFTSSVVYGRVRKNSEKRKIASPHKTAQDSLLAS